MAGAIAEARCGGPIRAAAVSAAACAVAVAIAAPARAATTVGAVAGPADTIQACEDPVNLVQKVDPSGFSYRIPEAGVITGWRTRSPVALTGTTQMGLQVWRPAGADQYTFVGGSAVQTTLQEGINAFPANVDVLAGDRLGVRGSNAPCGSSSADAAARIGLNEDTAPQPGESRSLPPKDPPSAVQLNVAVTVGQNTPPPPPPTDIVLNLTAKKKQKPNKLSFTATCDQDCTIEVDGKAKVQKPPSGKASTAKKKKKSYPLADTTTEVSAGVATEIGLGFDRGKTTRKIKKTLKASRKAAKRSKVKATVSASGVAGQATTEPLTIKLKP